MTDKSIEYYREQFYREAFDIIEKIYEDILKAEAEPDKPEHLNSLFRGIHTIKGSAGSFGLENISIFVHHLEDILNKLRESRIQLSPELTDLILASVDNVSKMIKSHQSGLESVIDMELMEQLKAFNSSINKELIQDAIESSSASCKMENFKESSLPPQVRREIQESLKQGLHIYLISPNYESEHLENGYDPVVFLKNIKSSSHYYHVVKNSDDETLPVPPLSHFKPMNLYLAPVICAATQLSMKEILEMALDPSLVFIQEIKTDSSPLNEQALPESADQESVKEFIIGTSEMLESAERAVIEYEKHGSISALNEIFRVVHNIKGDADFIGLKYMTSFAHALESLLEKLRSGSAGKKGTVDILLKSVDYFWQNIRKLEQGMELTGFPACYENLKKRIDPESKEDKSTDTDFYDDDLKSVFFDQMIQYKSIIQSGIHAVSEPKQQQMILRALTGLSNASKVIKMEKIQAASEHAALIFKDNDMGSAPAALNNVLQCINELNEEPRRIGEIFVSEGKITREELADGLSKQKRIGEILMASGKISEDDILKALTKQKLMEKLGRAEPAESSIREVRTMRVDENKIEQLTNMAGELLIARNTYGYLLDKLKDKQDESDLVYKALKENLYLFTRLTNDIHYGIVSLRMISVSGLFRKFSRTVRDISRSYKKGIDLIIEGEEVEIDKKAAEVLTDPMMHLIRNACDHGIETEEERLAAGKAERGTILMKAFREGGNLCILIKDDGRGIDREKLFEKAREKNLPFNSPDDPEFMDIIFMPGISTCSTATSISGRGVGMDVVRTAVQSLGGKVHAASTPGKGSEFLLSIPMTMGMEEVLLTQVRENIYAVPISYILGTLKVPVSKIKKVLDRMFFYYRGEVVFLKKLETLLYGKERKEIEKSFSKDADKQELSVVIIKTRKEKYGMIVDCFYRNMELAVKPLPKQLAGIDIASGVSIMGDGMIILILNPEQIK